MGLPEWPEHWVSSTGDIHLEVEDKARHTVPNHLYLNNFSLESGLHCHLPYMIAQMVYVRQTYISLVLCCEIRRYQYMPSVLMYHFIGT